MINKNQESNDILCLLNSNWRPFFDLSCTNYLFIKGNKFLKVSLPRVEKFLNFENYKIVLDNIKKKLNSLTLLQIKDFFIKNKKFYLYTNYLPNLKNANMINYQNYFAIFSNLIKKLHKIKLKGKIEKWDWEKKLDLYRNLIKNPTKKSEIFYFFIKKLFKGSKVTNWKFCHNDLLLNNFVLYKEKWYLIDFEYATLNEDLFDIASFASENLNKNSYDKWFQQFVLTSREKIKLKMWLNYQDLIWYYWGKFMYANLKKKKYQKIYQQKFRRINLKNLLILERKKWW